MRTLPTGSVDPNFGRRVRNRRQLNSLQNTLPYGYSMTIAVRYTQDAFSRSGWLWPVDAKGFFFSSRRRHTRCSRDWSSDVCSSDLSTAHHGEVDTLDVLALRQYHAFARPSKRIEIRDYKSGSNRRDLIITGWQITDAVIDRKSVV